MINQQAQDHATACALYARLLGQLVPTFMTLPVLHKYLYEPSQGMALHNVERAPREIRSHEIPIRLFTRVFQGNDKAFGFVGTDIHLLYLST